MMFAVTPGEAAVAGDAGPPWVSFGLTLDETVVASEAVGNGSECIEDSETNSADGARVTDSASKGSSII